MAMRHTTSRLLVLLLTTAILVVGVVPALGQTGSRLDACTQSQSVTAAAGSGATATLPAPAPNVGQLFHYICYVKVGQYAAALLTAGATPVLVTTTNIGAAAGPTLSFQAAALAQGVSEEQVISPATPLKSFASNTATTIVAPSTTSVIWRITVFYYVAP